MLIVQPVERAKEADVLLHRQRFIERKLLRHVSDAPLDVLGVAADVDAVDHCRPRRGLQQAAHHADGRRLARAIRAEKAKDFPSLDFEADAIDSRKRAEPARQIADEDRRVAHYRPSALWSRARASSALARARVRSSSACNSAVCASSTSMFVATPALNRSAITRRASAADRTPTPAASIAAVGRRQLRHPLPDLDFDAGIEITQSRVHGTAVRRRFCRLRANAPSVEQRPANVHANVPRRRPLVLNGENLEVRPRRRRSRRRPSAPADFQPTLRRRAPRPR